MAKKKKETLGMGIRALLDGINVDGSPEVKPEDLLNTVIEVPVEQVTANPFQPRKEFDKERLEELAESIKIFGVVQPVTVRFIATDRYQLIAGERRWRASQIAGKETIPAYILAADDRQMLEIALIENIQREDLNAMEVAQNYQRLIDECELTHEELSARLGKKRSTITNYLGLLRLPPEIQVGLKSKVISMGHARSLVGINKVDIQLSLYHQIKDKSLSVRQTEALVHRLKEGKGEKNAKNTPQPNVHIQKVQDNLAEHLEAKVMLKSNPKGKGQIVIRFNSDDDLNRILEILGL